MINPDFIPIRPANQTAKADAGKLDLTLVPLQIIEDVAEVREYLAIADECGFEFTMNWRG